MVTEKCINTDCDTIKDEEGGERPGQRILLSDCPEISSCYLLLHAIQWQLNLISLLFSLFFLNHI